MEERNGSEKVDEVMLPGFRFHPTDEELVGFYLNRKIQQRPLSIEIIKQLDIYKYDPWDLPKMASSGEKEWYFYCPRDRKYRNSARPNRVTGAGFWKATGTDRPIYSSEGSKCIGLKKSLVFYKGRAAKGVKTDWMMHEFRLPSLTSDSSSSPKKYLNKTIPPNESWAICRIFKKTNATAQRALSHSWVHPLHETSTTSNFLKNDRDNNQFCSTNMMLTKKQSFNTAQEHLSTSSNSSLCPIDITTPYNNPIIDPLIYKPLYRYADPIETSSTCNKSSMDVSSLLLSMSSSVLGGDFNKGTTSSSNYSGLQQGHDHNDGYPMLLQREMQGNIYNQGDNNNVVNVPRVDDQLVGFPFSVGGDAWKSSLLWDTSSCTSDSPSGYSTTKCYT